MRQVGTVHSIQLLRFIAASLVVLFHSHQAFTVASGPSAPVTENYLFGFGAVGVHIFFVISGFIMVLTSVRPGKPYDAAKFFKRRFLRIYPIYWICVVIYIGVHGLIDKPYYLSTEQTISALLLRPDGAAQFIGPAWTLSYEMFFYICFGLAMMLSLTRGLIALFLFFGALMAIGHFVEPTHYDLKVITNPLLAEFLAGAAIGWLAQKRLLPLKWGPALTAFGIALFAGGIVADYTRWPTQITWGIPSAVLILGLVSWESDRGAAPVVQRFSVLGDSSYVLYLIHIAVITLAGYLVQNLATPYAPPALMAAVILLLVSLALAEAIHRGIERPMLHLLNPARSLVPPRAQEAPHQS